MKAKMHNDSLFKGRQITVIDKRKNKPGMGHGGLRGNNAMAQMLSVMQMMMKRGGRGGFRGGAMGPAMGAPMGAS